MTVSGPLVLVSEDAMSRNPDLGKERCLFYRELKHVDEVQSIPASDRQPDGPFLLDFKLDVQVARVHRLRSADAGASDSRLSHELGMGTRKDGPLAH